jgi:hypothetical protein
MTAEHLGGYSGHFLHPARFSGSVMEHQIFIKNRRNARKPTGTIERVKCRKVGMSTPEDMDNSIIANDIRYYI